MAYEAARAAENLVEHNVSAEVIDLRSVRPIDEEIIIRSLRKTGRLVVADTSWALCWVSAEVAAIAAEKAWQHLKTPVRRVPPPDCPAPVSVCRVCPYVLFTTPNKQLPVELHTWVPVLHWLPGGVYRAVLRRLGFAYFADVENLNLLDASSFLSLFPGSRRNELIRIGPPLLRSNLLCVSQEIGQPGTSRRPASSRVAGEVR